MGFESMFGRPWPNLPLVALGSLCLTLLFLLTSSHPVSANSSGDAPPATGDWDIYNATALWDETRVIQGSINVNGGSLNLTNVTLHIQGHLRVNAPTTIAGSNLIITSSGGKAGVDVREILVLDNTTLRLNLTVNPTQETEPEQQQVLVRGEGTLLIHNDSLISDGLNEEDDDTAAPDQISSPNYRLRFIVQAGARFEVYDSTISEVGWNDPVTWGENRDYTRGGLSLNTDDVILHNVTFTKCWYGVYLFDGAVNLSIDNSTFLDLERHGVVTNAENGRVENSTFRDSNFAIMAYYTSNRWVVKDNRLEGMVHGFQLNHAGRFEIHDNIIQVSGRAFDLRGDADNHDIHHNTITGGAYGVWTEGVRQGGGGGGTRYYWNPRLVNFHDNELVGVATGIHFDGGANTDRTRSGGDGILITGNTFAGGTAGIVVFQGEGQQLIDDFTISGNRLVNLSDTGIQLTQLLDSNVTGNRITGGSIAVKLMACEGLHFWYNLLTAPNFTGFHLTDDSNDNELDNNTIEGSLGQGFYLKDSGPNAIHHNRVANFTGAGLWVEEQVTVEFTDNVVEHGGQGFHLVSTAPTIRDNTLNDLQWGYYLLDVTLASLQDELTGMTRGRLWQEHSLTVKVEDEEGTAKRNIEVEVYDLYGRLAAADASDTDGLTRAFNLTHYQLDPQGDRTDFTPHAAWAYRGTGAVEQDYTADTPLDQLTLQIDMISPASWVVSQGDYVNTTQVQVTWQVLGGHTDVVMFSVDYRFHEPGEPYTNWTSLGYFTNTTTSLAVSEGNTYQVRSQAEDDFGNIEDASSEWEFVVDLTPPSSVLTSPDVEDGEKTALEVIHLEWAPVPLVSEIDSYTLLHRWREVPSGLFGQWTVYGGQQDTSNDNIDFVGPGGFEYQLKVLAVDPAGNRELKSEPDLTFTLDHEPPEAWLVTLPDLIDGKRLELTVDFPVDTDLEFVTIRYLKYLEARYEEGDAPSGTWLNLGVYDRDDLRLGPIVIDQLATDSYYLFRLVAQDDIGNLDDRVAIQEFYTGDGTAGQSIQLERAVEPAGSSYPNGHVKVQALQGEDYGSALRQSTSLPLENPDMYYLDERTGLITFGDGQSGFQPADGQSIRVTYDGYDGRTLVDYSPPAAPTQLNSEKLSNTSIRLTWHVPGSLDVAAYRVEFSYNVMWQNMTTVAHAPTSGFVSATLENLTRTVYHFRVVSIDRVGLESTPTGEVKVDLSLPVEDLPGDDDDDEGPPIMVIALILIVALGACGAAFHVLGGRNRSDREGRPGKGASASPAGKRSSTGPRLEPVTRDLDETGAAGREPDPHAQYSRPSRRSSDISMGPAEEGPADTGPDPVSHPALDPTTATGPVGPGPAPDTAAAPGIAGMPEAADGAVFQLFEGELVCTSCGTARELVPGDTEVTCAGCGVIGPVPTESSEII